MILESIFVVFVSLICIISFSRSRTKAREQSDKVQLGLSLLTYIQKVMALSQQHRGMSNAVLQGNDKLKRRLISLQTDLDQLMAAGSALNLTEFSQWESFSEHWPRLKKRAVNCELDPKNLIRQHNMMIDGQLSLLDDIISYYGLRVLKLDNTTHASELCLDILRVIETIAQARGLGSGICAKGECVGVDQISLNFLAASISASTSELINELNSIDNATLSDQFNASSALIKSGGDHLTYTMNKHVLVDGETTISASDYFNLASKPIDDLLDIFNAVVSYASTQYTKKAK